jgi:hypothetical protein
MISNTPSGALNGDVSETGTILLFVLVLLGFVSLGVGPVVNAAFANAETTSVVRSVNNGFYAADGGVEYAIQELRTGTISCGSQSVPISVPSSFDGEGGLPITVNVTCTQTSTLSTSILTATITSSVGASSNEKHVTATAVVAINLLAPTRNDSVESWSSTQS